MIPSLPKGGRKASFRLFSPVLSNLWENGRVSSLQDSLITRVYRRVYTHQETSQSVKEGILLVIHPGYTLL